MAEFGKENKVTGVFGGVQFDSNNGEQAGNIGNIGNYGENAGTIRRKRFTSKTRFLEQIQSILVTRN